MALDIMFKKYETLIYKLAAQIYPYGDKMQDLVQEGRIILNSCIEHYDPELRASFYTYFTVSLKRRLFKLRGDDYYTLRALSEEESLMYLSPPNSLRPCIPESFFDTRLEMDIYNECILGNSTIALFADRAGMKYSRVYKVYVKIISRLKRSFSID